MGILINEMKRNDHGDRGSPSVGGVLKVLTEIAKQKISLTITVNHILS